MKKFAVAAVLIFTVILLCFTLTACNPSSDKLYIDEDSIGVLYDYQSATNTSVVRLTGDIVNDSNVEITGVKLKISLYDKYDSLLVTKNLKSNISAEDGESVTFVCEFAITGELYRYEITESYILFDNWVNYIIYVVVALAVIIIVCILTIVLSKIKKTYEYQGHIIEVQVRSRKSFLIVDGQTVDSDNSFAVVNLRLEGSYQDLNIIVKVGMGFFRARVTTKVNGETLEPVKKNKKS